MDRVRETTNSLMMRIDEILETIGKRCVKDRDSFLIPHSNAITGRELFDLTTLLSDLKRHMVEQDDRYVEMRNEM